MSETGEFRRNWRELLACFLGVMVGFSSTWFYSAGLFLLPVSRELGVGMGSVSLSPLICSMAAAVAAPFIGKVIDRIGAAIVGIAALCGLALSFFLIAQFTVDLQTFLAFSGLIALLGAGSTAISFSRIVVDLFSAHRGMALGFMLTGTGLGAFVIPLVIGPVIEAEGWRAAYRLLAIVVLVVAVPITLLLWRQLGAARVARADVPHVSAVSLFGRPLFLALVGVFLLASYGVVSVLVHFVPMLIDRGIPSTRAAALASLIGVALIPGRLLTGFLLDRFTATRVAAGVFALVAAGVMLFTMGDASFAIFGAVVAGLGIGAEIDLLAFLVARHFRESYAQAYGWVFSAFLVGGAIGPGVTGFLRDYFGRYEPAMAVCVAAMAAAAYVVLSIEKYASRAKNAI